MSGSAPVRSAWLPVAVRRRLDPAGRFGLRVTLAALSILLIAIPFAFLLLQVRRSGPLLSVDRSVATTLHGAVRERDGLTLALKAVTSIGTFFGHGSLVVAGTVVLVRARRWRLVAFLLTTTIGGWILNNVVKIAVGRQRPTFEDPLATAHGLSFPSGHAMNSVVVLGALLMVFLPAVRPTRHRAVVAATVALMLLIGFTRLALGVHYLSDVVAGFVLGGAWLTACVAAFSVWRVERGRRPVHAIDGLEPEAEADLRSVTTSDRAESGQGR